MGFFLSILGFGRKIASFVFNFAIKNWKLVLPILLLAGAFFYVKHEIKQAYHTGYEAGVTYESGKREAAIDAQNKRNREVEQGLANSINSFGHKVAQDAAKRAVEQAVVTERVTKIIQTKPIYQDCKVDPEVLDARNEIRRMGPVIRYKMEDIGEK